MTHIQARFVTLSTAIITSAIITSAIITTTIITTTVITTTVITTTVITTTVITTAIVTTAIVTTAIGLALDHSFHSLLNAVGRCSRIEVQLICQRPVLFRLQGTASSHGNGAAG